MSDHPKCIDISHWQGFPNFAEVEAAGVIAMIHKATEGVSYVDPNRSKNCSAAIAQGIAVATYHWLSPGVDPVAQMKFYLKTVDPVIGERVVIDYEEDGCTLDELKAAVQALLDDPRDLQITVYSGHLLKEQLGSKHDAFLADNTDLWLAQYTTGTPTWPNGTYPTWMLWQYSESGIVDGIDGSKVDLNRFVGSDADLLAWISPAGGAPPFPQPGEKEVAIDITVPDGVTVSITINGVDVTAT
jgi:lysozyme